ncbi:MAG: hypothetical protein GX834_02410, partial [Clostridiaceae bacterium]|nr:hypothetical protein [Clostridiaceae bacterium]
IASWDGSTATVIKSMDLTAPSYAAAQGADKQLQSYLLELANFQGASLISKGVEYSVTADQIKQKRLILVIPGNYPGWLDQSQRNYWQAAGAGYGIQLEIREYGNSMRYQEPETEPLTCLSLAADVSLYDLVRRYLNIWVYLIIFLALIQNGS